MHADVHPSSGRQTTCYICSQMIRLISSILCYAADCGVFKFKRLLCVKLECNLMIHEGDWIRFLLLLSLLSSY